MSDPKEPHNPQHPEGISPWPGSNSGGNDQSYDSNAVYPGSNVPEDNTTSGFDPNATYDQSSYQQAAASGYNEGGYQQYPGANNQAYVQTDTGYLAEGTGKSSFSEGMSFGFSGTFKSWGAWIGSTFIFGIIVSIVFGVFAFAYYMANADAFQWSMENPGTPPPESLQPSGPGLIFNIGITALLMFIALPFCSGALTAANGQKVTMKDIFKIPNFSMAAVYCLIYAVVFGGLSSLTSEMGLSNGSSTDINVGGLVLALVINVVVGLVGFLFVFAPLYIIDRGSSVVDAMKSSISAVARNFLPLLGFNFLFGIFFFLSIITLGLALLILVPAYYIGLTLMYRQASGGLYPEQS